MRTAYYVTNLCTFYDRCRRWKNSNNLSRNDIWFLLDAGVLGAFSNVHEKRTNSIFVFLGNRLECDCNLSWLRTLANETANEQIRMKLQQLSCYMKGNYYSNDDIDQEINPNGLSDSRLLRDGTIDSRSHGHENMPDNVDRMLKLFNIPPEALPCPEKKQANEILMEQISKNESINGAPRTVFVFELLIFIAIAGAFVL